MSSTRATRAFYGSAMFGPSQPRHKCTVHEIRAIYIYHPSIYHSIYLHAWCASCLSTPESPGMPVECLATPSGHTASRVGLRESASAWCPFHIESASPVHTAWGVVSASSTLFTLSSSRAHRKEERLPKDPPSPGWKPTSEVPPSSSQGPRSLCRRLATSCLKASILLKQTDPSQSPARVLTNRAD